MLIHVLTVPISYGKLPPGSYLALIAFSGIITIVLVTLAPRIAFLNKLTGQSYAGWKKLHRTIGLFFILGYLHSLTVGALAMLSIQSKWLQIFFVIGTASYIYTEFLGGYFKKFLPYTVETVNHHNSSTAEVVMRPRKAAIQPNAWASFCMCDSEIRVWTSRIPSSFQARRMKPKCG